MKCVWHPDQIASGSVNLIEGAYACHACDMKGDIFSLVMKVEGMPFVEALDFVRGHFAR